MALNALVFAPFNQILGTASTNVPAYSNTDDERFSIERHYMHGIYMGIKWQCVEYARRWLLLRKSCTFKNVRHAADIWTEITYVERVSDGEHFPLKAHPNGSPTLPKIDSFLIYSRCTEQPVGHIAVICEVGPNYIGIAEQNNKFHYWDGEYARQIPMIYKDGLYYIEDEDPIYG
jgi:trypanothione synthetase/amidase